MADQQTLKGKFLADNKITKMVDVLDAMTQSKHFDVCTAFLDAYGITNIGSAAENNELRLLVGYDLKDFPISKDIVTFEMAREWQENKEDAVYRKDEDEFIDAAIKYLELESFQVAKADRQTHSKLYVNENMGVVGSSNLTRAGIEGQRELNLFQYEPSAVAKLREWFDLNWNTAKAKERENFKKKLIEWLRSSKIKKYAPFYPYAKAIYERYKHRFITMSASATDINLAIFQEEGRDTVLSILAEHKCCIIADAVGLGKTFIALGAMQKRSRSKQRSKRKILVICPAQLENVWERTSKDLGVNLTTESMETLGNTTSADSYDRINKLSQFSLIIIDEAHNFRNPNSNRFQNLMQILQEGEPEKEILLLTATPINNSIQDLYSLYRLMTKDRDDFFISTNLRIPSIKEFFKNLERNNVTATDLLLETMVCRSRLDIKRRQQKNEVIVINDQQVKFPERQMTTLEYNLSQDNQILSYEAITSTIDQLKLGAYNIEQYSKSPDEKMKSSFMKLQALFKILLLKRLESSIHAFINSSENLLNFSRQVVSSLKKGHKLTSDEYRKMMVEASAQLEDDDDSGRSSYFNNNNDLDPNEYNIENLSRDVADDIALLEPLINKAKNLLGAHDGKLAVLRNHLKTLLPNQKVLIFTYYADTARYIHDQLDKDKEFNNAIKNARMEYIIGGLRPNLKTKIVEEFAPRANDNKRDNYPPIQLLISTDVLAEGQNLQDCGYIINYDLHFNPVRLIQRNGRIDRLFSPHDTITIANFFPEGGLEEQLKLIEKLQRKIENIQNNMPMDSSIIGEKVRLFSLEELRKTKAGDAEIIDDIDSQNPINKFNDIVNEVIKMLQDFGMEEVNKIPFGCQSNKWSTKPGVFLCVSAGNQLDHKQCWWLYYPIYDQTAPMVNLYEDMELQMEPSLIIDNIRSSKPAEEKMNKPECGNREIRWDIILRAQQKCREMLIAQYRSAERGQTWHSTHINKKIQIYLANKPDEQPNNITQRLGRFSLEKHKKHAETMMKINSAENTAKFIDWLNETLPPWQAESDNPETMPLTIVSYLELVPETEAAQ